MRRRTRRCRCEATARLCSGQPLCRAVLQTRGSSLRAPCRAWRARPYHPLNRRRRRRSFADRADSRVPEGSRYARRCGLPRCTPRRRSSPKAQSAGGCAADGDTGPARQQSADTRCRYREAPQPKPRRRQPLGRRNAPVQCRPMRGSRSPMREQERPWR